MNKNLKQLREDRKMTRKEVANNIKTTVTYVYLIETGKRNPGDSIKESLAKLYKVDIATIFLAIKLTKH